MPNKNNFIPKENIAKIEEIRELEEGIISWDAGQETELEIPFVSQVVLMITKSQLIMERINESYPTIAELLEYNRSGTIGFLKANGALSGYNITHKFKVPYSGNDDGIKVGSDYKDHIEYYVAKLCREKVNKYYEQLEPAREVLSKYIHQEYYKKFPTWPSVSQREQSGKINLKISNSYRTVAYHLIGSCLGWIEVTDRRKEDNVYEAEFTGKPDIKLLIFDDDEMKEWDRLLSQEGIEAAKIVIDKTQQKRDRNLLRWEDLK